MAFSSVTRDPQRLHRGCHRIREENEGKFIATVGVANLIVIQDGDVTFVADRREEETIRQLDDRFISSPPAWKPDA